MNELSNTVTSMGNYNNIPTSLTSNTNVVNIIEGLSLTKQADKQNWSDGNLTYTITLDNKSDNTYSAPVVTDIIDTSLVDFVEDSVTIDDIKALESQYSYNSDTHTLTVNLSDCAPSTTVIVKFSVKKKIQWFLHFK